MRSYTSGRPSISKWPVLVTRHVFSSGNANRRAGSSCWPSALAGGTRPSAGTRCASAPAVSPIVAATSVAAAGYGRRKTGDDQARSSSRARQSSVASKPLRQGSTATQLPSASRVQRRLAALYWRVGSWMART
jgi:hypothetical protein